MPTLDLYKARTFNTVKLTDQVTKQEVEYKLPNEYTVEEIERLLELQIKREAMEKEPVKDRGEEQLQKFWAVVFEQLEILFQHYQPEVTADQLRSMVTRTEALEMLSFYDKYRFLEKDPNVKGKKKVQ